MTVTDLQPGELGHDGQPAFTVHDFRRPEGLTRPQRHLVDAGLARFGVLAGEEFVALMRRPIAFELLGIEELTWGGLTTSRDDQLHCVLFSLDPLDGTAALLLPVAIARVIADLRLAGPGTDDSDRPLDTIERELADQVAQSVLHRLHTAFADLLTVNPVLVAPEPGSDPLEVFGADDDLLVARFELTLDEHPACAVDLCLAAPTLRGLVEALRSRLSHLEAGRTRPPTRQAAERLAYVPLEVTLQFPTIVTTAESVLQLAVGDELSLGIPTSEPLELRAEGLLVARATIGRSGDRKACSIVEEVLP